MWVKYDCPCNLSISPGCKLQIRCTFVHLCMHLHKWDFSWLIIFIFIFLLKFWSFRGSQEGSKAKAQYQLHSQRPIEFKSEVSQSLCQEHFQSLRFYYMIIKQAATWSVDQFSYTMELLKFIVQPLTSVLSKFSASWKIKFFQIFCWWKTFIGLRTFISPMEGRNGETLLSKSPYKNW